MLNECPNCGSKIKFNPKHKGNKCVSCNSFFPVEYQYKFEKKTFKENTSKATNELAEVMRNVKCKSCGASMLFNKYEVHSKCPYCGTVDISKSSKKKLMDIDSIIPFALDKEEALIKLKQAIKSRFLADKKLFKNITVEDVQGVYVNSFIFDFSTKSTYRGVLSYTKDYGDDQKTIRKSVEGIFEKEYNNVVIEANSNLKQDDFTQILPFDQDSSVKFNLDFIHGYILEYQDRLFDDSVALAQKLIKNRIEYDILRTHNCTKIEELDLNTEYVDKKYCYTLLPVYFVTKTVKDQKHTVIINGQTGQVGKTPKDKKRVAFLTVLMVLVIAGIVFLLSFFGGE